MMHKIGINIHGVSLTLEADEPLLVKYAAAHLHGCIEEARTAPDLEVKCSWINREWDPESNPFSENGALHRIGKRMLGNPNELVWLNTLKMKGLQLRFCKRDGRWTFEVRYHFHPKKDKLDLLPDYKYKKYFSLVSYLVYYPLIWYLEATRQWTVLHASALAYGDQAILIGGLGGVGKTTTCVALMQKKDMRLISENLIFTDGQFIYPCYEPIRLSDESLEMLGALPPGLARMHYPEGLKDKGLFHLQTRTVPPKVRAGFLFLPQFGKRFLSRVETGLTFEKIMAMNRLTRELDDYSWYAAAMNLHWPTVGRTDAQLYALRALAQRVHCYELGIDRTAGVDAVVSDILRAVENA